DTLPRARREWRRRKWDQVVEDERLQYPQLWVAEIATGRHRRLTSGETYVWYVRWSPDSRRIAFLLSPTGKADDANREDIGIVPGEGAPGGPLGGRPYRHPHRRLRRGRHDAVLERRFRHVVLPRGARRDDAARRGRARRRARHAPRPPRGGGRGPRLP